MAAYLDKLHDEGLRLLNKDHDPEKSILSISAMFFLLHAHILIECPLNEEIQIRIEHKSIGDKLLERIVSAINDWLPK